MQTYESRPGNPCAYGATAIFYYQANTRVVEGQIDYGEEHPERGVERRP